MLTFVDVVFCPSEIKAASEMGVCSLCFIVVCDQQLKGQVIHEAVIVQAFYCVYQVGELFSSFPKSVHVSQRKLLISCFPGGKKKLIERMPLLWRITAKYCELLHMLSDSDQVSGLMSSPQCLSRILHFLKNCLIL